MMSPRESIILMYVYLNLVGWRAWLGACNASVPSAASGRFGSIIFRATLSISLTLHTHVLIRFRTFPVMFAASFLFTHYSQLFSTLIQIMAQLFELICLANYRPHSRRPQ